MTTRPNDYDPVASAYATRFFRELDDKPFDRAWLDRFADITRGRGRVCDAGCGPGQVAAYLHARGVDAFGLDLSPAMISEARRLNPGLDFVVGDLTRLPLPDASLAGVAAFYAIVHLDDAQLATALGELHRVLAPGAPLTLAFHAGEETVHVDELLGCTVSLDFRFFATHAVVAALANAGFTVDEVTERQGVAVVEHPSRRAYVLCRR